jgi:hypothetical protein
LAVSLVFTLGFSNSTTLFTNLLFDLSTGVGGYTISAIDVNGVTPTLTSGTNVPFSTDAHGFNTNQIAVPAQLNITISVFSLTGCITVTDSLGATTQLSITGVGTYSFGVPPNDLFIDNITAVQVVCTDGICP